MLKRIIVWSVVMAFCGGLQAALPVVPSEEVGMDSGRLAAIDRLVAEAIAAGQMPGCVVAVGRQGKLALLKPYGHRQLEPSRLPMTADTLFDLASLTKPVATAASVMALWEQGKVRLDDPVVRHLPDFSGKETVTLLHLLTHQGGLIADNSLSDYRDGTDAAWKRILAGPPQVPPATKFIYSDMGFIVLGALVQKVSGSPLDRFVQDRLYRPLGMTETGYLPAEPLRQRAAPTERRQGKWMQGEVHDPRAFALGGVAGHAGLFSTANDLAVFAAMFLGHGQLGPTRIFQPQTIDAMTEARPVPGGLRGLGWDKQSGYSSNRSPRYSAKAFGHGGFTGTGMWIDPGHNLFVIFLSNRLHPDGKGAVNSLIAAIGTVAVDSIRK